jgi:hypothetical protein
MTVCSVAAEIDLTPSVREYTSQGFVYRQVKLKQDTQDIMFVLPQGWNVRGGKDRLQLQPPSDNFAEGTITANSLAAPKPFDEPTVKALEQQVLSQAPAGSQALQVVRREENPVAMGPNPSLEIVISYATLGHTFHRSVIFVHTTNAQLVFQFTSPIKEFDRFNGDFRRCMSSWQWINGPAASNTAVASK